MGGRGAGPGLRNWSGLKDGSDRLLQAVSKRIYSQLPLRQHYQVVSLHTETSLQS